MTVQLCELDYDAQSERVRPVLWVGQGDGGVRGAGGRQPVQHLPLHLPLQDWWQEVRWWRKTKTRNFFCHKTVVHAETAWISLWIQIDTTGELLQCNMWQILVSKFIDILFQDLGQPWQEAVQHKWGQYLESEHQRAEQKIFSIKSCRIVFQIGM